ncbi:MAG: hypothetical protein ACOYVK_17955 [Bacillota bacterium]
MYALFLILNDVYLLDDVLEVFYEFGVGATTIDSVGMGKVLLQHNVDVPIFSSIQKLLEGDKPYNKTIVSVIRNEEKLRKITDRINRDLEITRKGVGFMFVVPVLECYGHKLEEVQDK